MKALEETSTDGVVQLEKFEVEGSDFLTNGPLGSVLALNTMRMEEMKCSTFRRCLGCYIIFAMIVLIILVIIIMIIMAIIIILVIGFSNVEIASKKELYSVE